MPRPRSTCLARGLPLEELCSSCKNPRSKAKCLSMEQLTVVTEHARSTSSQQRATSCSFVTIEEEESQVMESNSGDDEIAPDVVINMAGGSITAECQRPADEVRIRKAPEMFQPTEFWRRELPAIAKDKATQLQRKAELDKLQMEERKQVYEEGVLMGKLLSKTQIERLEKLLQQAKSVIEKKGTELSNVTKKYRKLMDTRRQATLSNWLKQGDNDRPSMELPARSSHFHANLDNAIGYSATELKRTFRAHVARVEDFIEDITPDPLKQIQLADAVRRRFSGIRSNMARDNEAADYVMESLRNFESTLRERYHGRYPNEIRAAHQAVSAAITSKVPARKLSVVADATGFSLDALSHGRMRWMRWFDGTEEHLIEFRGRIRSDKMNEEWLEFAALVWEQETRPDPSTKCSIRNPHNRSDKKLYRIHYLDMRIGDMHQLILSHGREKFAGADPPFHFSWKYCVKVLFAVEP